MIEIINKEFFHISKQNSKNDSWKVGTIINTPSESNYFFDRMANERQEKIQNSGEKSILEYLDERLEKFGEQNRQMHLPNNEFEFNESVKSFNSQLLDLLDITKKELEQSLKMTRELIFENVRKTQFSNLPSRQRCIWLTNKKDLEKWWSEFEPNRSKKIYLVKANGKIFYADGSLIKLSVSRFSDFETLANIYWNGAKNPNEEYLQTEILFEGELEILEEYQNLSETL